MLVESLSVGAHMSLSLTHPTSSTSFARHHLVYYAIEHTAFTSIKSN